MLTQFHSIPTINLGGDGPLSLTQQAAVPLSLESPAVLLMTDFSRQAPVTVTPQTVAVAALEIMKRHHVRLLIVVSDQQQVLGVISARDVMGRKLMVAAQDAGLPREEVAVKSLMTPVANLSALTFDEVQRARVGDIMSSLKGLGEQHILVVEPAASGLQVVGLFSASDFARELNLPFEVYPEARSFAELERVIHHHHELI